MPLLQWRGSSIPLRGFSMREDVPWRGEHFQSFFAPHRAIVKMCFYKNKGPGKRPTFRRGHFRCSFSLKKCLRLFLPRGTFAFVRKNILGAHLLVLRGGGHWAKVSNPLGVRPTALKSPLEWGLSPSFFQCNIIFLLLFRKCPSSLILLSSVHWV